MENSQGNILVSALLILVVMNLLGIGLVQLSAKESVTATFKTVDSAVFHVTESCTQDAIAWLGNQATAPINPYNITAANLNGMMIGTETQLMLKKLSGYSFNCAVAYLLTKSVSGSESTGSGGEIGENSGYGAAGDLSPRYYYQINATGSGPQNASKQTATIVSVDY